MPKLVFTAQELKDYFDDKKFGHYRDECRKRYTELQIHANGLYPTELIECRRPNEPETVQEYRKKIFVPKTKPFFSKIESTLQKIRRSSDWNIRYPEGSFDRIVEGEKLQDYAEHNYPVFGSITNWTFSLLLRHYLTDANALVLISPMELPELENEFIKPVATIFNSHDVIDFVDGDYAVVNNKSGCYYRKGKYLEKGESYFIITTQSITRYDQISSRRDFDVMFFWEHGLGELPVFKVGGIVVESCDNNILYESRVCGIVPEFNEALREYSDLQAAKVLHLYPERWEYTSSECIKCKGTGLRKEQINDTICDVQCNVCQGHGYVAAGPYSKLLIKPAGTGEQQLPSPPAGFVEKDVEIIKVQEQSIKDHIFYGLSAINFEFLAESPLSQSGTAKEVDKDEMNNTVHSIAEDLVAVMDKVYRLTAIYRYAVQYTVDDIEKMLPFIAVPEKYDILSGDHLAERVGKAKSNNANAAILNALEVEYAGKVFSSDPDVAERVSLILSLDPLANITEDDKMARLSNGGITKKSYVVSSNINDFVGRAIRGNTGFEDMPKQKQIDIINGYADELITSMDTATQITYDATADTEIDIEETEVV